MGKIQEICNSCQKPKAALTCGLCQGLVCKSCAQRFKENSFSFFPEIPLELKHRIYCGRCFDSRVAPVVFEYEQTMERAKKVVVYLKAQGEETRLMKRSEKPFKVLNCLDREETLLRLAFFAAQKNFNALIDVELAYKKLRNAGYQTTRWDGAAVPTQLDPQFITDTEND
jgi:hypothetical protein